MLKPEDEFLYAGRKYVEGESDLCGVICMADNEHFHILIVAATDNELCMHRVKRSLKTLEEQEIVPDILITTCRRFDSQEFKMMSEIMEWELKAEHRLYDRGGKEIIQFPLLKVKYESTTGNKAVIDWYNHLTTILLAEYIDRLVQVAFLKEHILDNIDLVDIL